MATTKLMMHHWPVLQAPKGCHAAPTGQMTRLTAWASTIIDDPAVDAETKRRFVGFIHRRFADASVEAYDALISGAGKADLFRMAWLWPRAGVAPRSLRTHAEARWSRTPGTAAAGGSTRT